jgi:hypothetical protein
MHRSASLIRPYLIGIVIAFSGAGGSAASFVSTSPDPFPPGSGFVQAPGCLSGPLLGLCTSDVKGLILSSSSNVVSGNQLFVLEERVTGELSFGGSPAGDFSVEGPLELTLDGRTSSSETGTFSGPVTKEDFTGTFDGASVEFTLDPSQASTVQVTITQFQNAALFQIDSSFSLYSQISIDGGTPIPIGGFPISGVGAVPEPSTWVLMSLSMLVLGFAGQRAKAQGASFVVPTRRAIGVPSLAGARVHRPATVRPPLSLSRG